jgi:hypothetical protein
MDSEQQKNATRKGSVATQKINNDDNNDELKRSKDGNNADIKRNVDSLNVIIPSEKKTRTDDENKPVEADENQQCWLITYKSVWTYYAAKSITNTIIIFEHPAKWILKQKDREQAKQKHATEKDDHINYERFLSLVCAVPITSSSGISEYDVFRLDAALS